MHPKCIMVQMPASKYNPEQKAKALDLHEKLGPAEAARQTGIPKNTIASWAKRGGVQTVAVANTAAAVEMAKLTREASREELRDELLASARERLRAMDEKMPVTAGPLVAARVSGSSVTALGRC